MEYTINPSSDGLYIILKIKGEMTRQIAMQLNLEAHARGREWHIRRYLVDVTEARNTDTVLDSYDFAYSDMQTMEGIDKFARVATLVDPNDHSHDFIGTVTRNSGLNVRLFTDLDQAKQFLLAEYTPDTAKTER